MSAFCTHTFFFCKSQQHLLPTIPHLRLLREVRPACLGTSPVLGTAQRVQTGQALGLGAHGALGRLQPRFQLRGTSVHGRQVLVGLADLQGPGRRHGPRAPVTPPPRQPLIGYRNSKVPPPVPVSLSDWLETDRLRSWKNSGSRQAAPPEGSSQTPNWFLRPERPRPQDSFTLIGSYFDSSRPPTARRSGIGYHLGAGFSPLPGPTPRLLGHAPRTFGPPSTRHPAPGLARAPL